MALPLPQWFQDLAPEDQERERTRLLLRIAAVYYSCDGAISELSEACGYAASTLGQLSYLRRPLSPQTCLKIEKAVGHDFLPRALLNPHIFEVPSDRE